MRKLCSIKQITKITPIDGADRIELATIDNWHTIVPKKENYIPGDWVMFFEPDALIPIENDYFNFLDIITQSGLQFYLVSSKKMKGIKSQGLAISFDTVTSVFGVDPFANDNWTTELEIQLYDKYDGQLPDGIIGPRPSYVPSLDIERIQNKMPVGKVIGTLKYDGEQRTIYFENGILRYASKTALLDINENCESNRTLFENLSLQDLARSYYVVCEYIGRGIRKNRHNLPYKGFRIISLFFYDGRKLPQEFYGEIAKVYKVNFVDNLGGFELPDNLKDIVTLTKEKVGNLEGMVVEDVNGDFYKIVLDELE